MSRCLNVEKLEKKFASVTSIKESIQHLSTWIIYHSDYRNDIVKLWVKALRNAEISHRLTLFYLANDVIQHKKKPIAVEYRIVFKPTLEEAIPLVRASEIKDEIRRMISIWSSRNIYSEEYLDHLVELLNSSSISVSTIPKEQKVDPELLRNFEIKNLASALKELSELKSALTAKEIEISSIRNFTLPQATMMKMHTSYTNKRIMRKLDKMKTFLKEYVALGEKRKTLQDSVLEQITIATAFYSTQSMEVKKVVSAYRLFDRKLQAVKQGLNEKMATFPETLEPESSSSFCFSDEASSSHSSIKNLQEDVCTSSDTTSLENVGTLSTLPTTEKTESSDLCLDMHLSFFTSQTTSAEKKPIDNSSDNQGTSSLNSTETSNQGENMTNSFSSDLILPSKIENMHQDVEVPKHSPGVSNSLKTSKENQKTHTETIDISFPPNLLGTGSRTMELDSIAEQRVETSTEELKTGDTSTQQSKIDNEISPTPPVLDVEKPKAVDESSSGKRENPDCDTKLVLLKSVKLLNKFLTLNKLKTSKSCTHKMQDSDDSKTPKVPFEFVFKLLSQKVEHSCDSMIDDMVSDKKTHETKDIESDKIGGDMEPMDMELDSE